MRTKNHPPPVPRKTSGAFFGNGGGCFHSCEFYEKKLVIRPVIPILPLMNSDMIRDIAFASLLKIDLKHAVLPDSIPSEAHAAVKAWLAERLANAETYANGRAEAFNNSTK